MTDGKRTSRVPVGAARRARQPSREALLARIRELEGRLEELERHVALGTRPVLRKQPDPAGPPRPRCPGCHLPLVGAPRGPLQALPRGHCPWCGFLFDAVTDARRPVEGKAK